jgi:hypothetical protein
MRAEDHFIADAFVSLLKGNSDFCTFFETFPKRYPTIDWQYTLEQLKREGIAPMLWFYIDINELKPLIFENVYSSLADYFKINLIQNMSALGEAKKAFSKFRAAGIPLVVLKGLFLIEYVYPHPAMRGLSDIDILVHKADIFRVDECLQLLGYSAKDSTPKIAVNNPPGYLASLDYFHEKASVHHIHVHWHLVNTSVPAYMFTPGMDMEYIWEKTIVAKIADIDVKILCPEHAFIYLCEHALRVGHSFDRLILVSDIILLWKAYEDRINWIRLWEESRKLHLDRFLFLALTILNIYTDNNSKLLRDLPSYKLRWCERIFIYLHRKKRRLRGSSFLIYLSMNSGWLAISRFLFRTFFPPAPILLQRRYVRGDNSSLSNTHHYKARVCEIVHHLWSARNLFLNK